MKYAKLYGSIFEGSLGQDWRLRSLFFDLLALCDWDGIVRLDYGGIAAITWRDINDVIKGITQLSDPDPFSRTDELEGRRVIPVDNSRPHMGFKIVNFVKYRDRGRRTSVARREQQAKWAREKRAKVASTNVDIASTPRRPESPSNVDQASTRRRPDVDHKRKIEDKSTKPPGSRASASSDPDVLHDVEAAQREISQQIFGGKLSKKHWSHEALRALAAQMPMRSSEIFTVGFYMSENKEKNPPSLTKLLEWWGDRYTKAAAWEEANYPTH